MSRILNLYKENKLFEAKKALIERADTVASLLLNVHKAEVASRIFEATAAKPKKPKRDKLTVDGAAAKPKRKIKFEFTEENEKKK